MRRRVIYKELITPEKAIERVRESYDLKPIGIEKINIENAIGRILAENIRSPTSIPPFTRSLVDGYAVKAEDTYGAGYTNPKTLKVKGRADAGSKITLSITNGECVEIATGAPLPKGANAVVMVEHTKRKNNTIEVYKPVTPGENVQGIGSDVRSGSIIAWKGTRLTPQVIGVLAASGVKEIKVYKRLKVGIISTGVELQPPGVPLEEAKIYDANTYSLYSALLECNCIPKSYGIIGDNEDELREVIERALTENDIVLCSGGTSAGLNDLVYRIVRDMENSKIIVEGLNIKPGKRTIIAIVKNKLFIGLPGFPVSTLMVFIYIVKPIIFEMLGASYTVEHVDAKLMEPIPGGNRRVLQPITLVKKGKSYHAYPVWGGSGSIGRFSFSDGFVVVPENYEGYSEGCKVKVYTFSENILEPNLYIFAEDDPYLNMVLEYLSLKYRIKYIISNPDRALKAVKNKHGDLGGFSVLDETTGTYNERLLKNHKDLVLIRGFIREYGIACKLGYDLENLIKGIVEGELTIANYNIAHNYRLVLDMILKAYSIAHNLNYNKVRSNIKGYNTIYNSSVEVRNAIFQGVVDVGIISRFDAETLGLNFYTLGFERYDFILHKSKKESHILSDLIGALRMCKGKLPGYYVT